MSGWPEELACFLIVSVYWIVRGRSLDRDQRRRALLEALAVSAGAWLTENSCIHLYGFYTYSPHWTLMIDRVPLAVLCIWPVVLDSAQQLAAQLGVRRVAVSVGVLVLTDAALIEPVSVASGLWQWSQPGIFSVPPIGMLGWAFFAALATGAPKRWMVVLAPLGTHALLLMLWWGALRWVNHDVPAELAVSLAWLVALYVALRAWQRPILPLGLLLQRVPAALFFFGLLGVRALDQTLLVAWVVAFAVPYLVLTARSRLGAAP